MFRSKVSAASSVLFVSLVLVLGLLAWLQSVSPLRVAQAATGLIDTTIADFNSGVITNCYVSPSGSDGLDGEVILSPTMGTDFSGNVLPSGWVSSTPGVATVSNGWLSVNEGGAGADYYPPGRVLEFEAVITAANFQHAGFAINLSDPSNPFAIFSTNGTDLRARTSTVLTEATTSLGIGYLGNPHRYRIEWGPSEVDYFIDGSWVATHTAAIGVSMHPAFQDFNSAGISLTVDWARLSDYAPTTCMFESRVFDSGIVSSGSVSSTFKGLTTTVVTPAGTSVAFEVITSTDGTTFGSTWTPVNPDGTFDVGPSQFIKYRATLMTTQPMFTPEIGSVRVWGVGPNGSGPNAVHLALFSAAGSDLSARGLLIGLSVAVLAIGSASVIFWRRKIMR